VEPLPGENQNVGIVSKLNFSIEPRKPKTPEPTRRTKSIFDDKKNEKKKTLTAEEKKKKAQRIIEKIPSSRSRLFDFRIEWKYLTQPLLEGRIKQWVTKKIHEFVGDDEPELITFILTLIEKKDRPRKILDEIKTVLDKEAEGFVIKLWRLIIYETEARRVGLSSKE